MLHGEPLLEDASMRNLGDGEGGYVADALERALLLPTDMEELRSMRICPQREEVPGYGKAPKAYNSADSCS